MPPLDCSFNLNSEDARSEIARHVADGCDGAPCEHVVVSDVDKRLCVGI